MRVLGATVLGVLVLAALPAAAAAEPWEASYRWQASSATGFEGWTANDTNPDSGLQGPWYRLWLGGSPFGRGVAAQPIGGRTYDNGDPTRETGAPSGRIVYAAPGGSRIVSGRFDDMELRDEDEGQYLRARIYGPTDAQRATRDFGAAYGQPSGVTHDLGPVEVEPSEPGTTAEAWLFTVCRPDPGTGVFMCPDVPSGSDSFGRFGTIELTLEDPDDPEIQIDAQPPIGDGWINERRTQRLTARATDPSSGIERIRVQLRRGPSTRTLTDRDVTCDRRHRTAGREGLVCPATASATATDPARDSSSRPREYVVTAWDYAGNQAQQTVTVRRDVTRPSSGRLSGELTELARDWTNRQGDVPVTLRGRDGQSGVARLELIADRVAGGRPTVLAASQPTCERGCTSASETATARLDRDTLPRDGRYRLSVRVTDRAGNQREFRSASTLKLDRAAPRRAGRAPFYRILRDGRVRVYFQPGRDPRESSGLGDFIVRYTPRNTNPAAAAIRFASVRMAAAPLVNYKRSRYRTLTLRGVDLSQPLAATQAGCDDARNGTPQPKYGGASANCSELVRARLTQDTLGIDYLRREQGLDKLGRYVNLAKDGRALAPALKAALGRLAKGISRTGLAAILGELVFVDSTGCDAKPTPREFNREARAGFGAARRALKATTTAPVGANLGRRQRVADARTTVSELAASTRNYLDLYGEPCDAPGKVAEVAIERVAPALEEAQRQLWALRDQKIRDDARAAAIRINRRARIGRIRCRDAGQLRKRFGGPGPGKANYTVYWSPPPPPDEDVEYVGISRALKERCRKHPTDRARTCRHSTCRA